MPSSRDRRSGQILPLFVLSLVAILAMAALLFDGANALAARRQLQNAGDAAALAGSNVIQAAGSIRACSATAGPPPGAPRSDIVAAVLASIDTNLPGFDHAKVTVTCPDGWSNQAVRVTLARESVGWFAGAIGAGPLDVATASTAVNGRVATTRFSVVLLDPSNASWPNGRRGCPAFLISGGPQITFEGSVQVNSACTAANGGALSTNGNSATLTMNNGATINMVGGYAPGPLTITPAPTTGAKSVKDPLADLDPPPYATMTVRSTSRLVLNNATQVLQPGVYRGGIQLRNSSVALLRPGIYVMDGGGLDLGAQASMCSISATSTVTNCTGTLASFCPDTSCGVLLYNRGTQSGSNAMGQVTIGAGATLKLRSYDERAMGGAFAEYRNLLLWQDVTPAPLSNWPQPTVALGGGGSVDLGGTIYAPSALVHMTGGSGGGGGGTNVTLQFIAWDLQIQGNSTFNFFYNGDEFARPTDYGLVE